MSPLALVAAYLVGAMPIGFIVARAFGIGDIRKHGSGNIGATNVLRTAGRLPAILTLVGDIAKGYGAVALAAALGGPDAAVAAAGAVAAVIGNCWSVFLKFRGGKGVATGLGALPSTTSAERKVVRHVHVDTLVIGAGLAGLEAARDAAADGSVLVCDEGAFPGPVLDRVTELRTAVGALGSVTLLDGSTALGIYEGLHVPIARGDELVQVYPSRVVVATGATGAGAGGVETVDSSPSSGSPPGTAGTTAGTVGTTVGGTAGAVGCTGDTATGTLGTSVGVLGIAMGAVGAPTVLAMGEGDGRPTITPTIAPTGLVVCNGTVYPELEGKLLFLSYNDGRIRAGTFAGDTLGVAVMADPGLGALFDIVRGPDGFLYVSTSTSVFRIEQPQTGASAGPGRADGVRLAVVLRGPAGSGSSAEITLAAGAEVTVVVTVTPKIPGISDGTSNITDGSSNISDGTSNTLVGRRQMVLRLTP